jgi:hypothetical protein
MKRLIFWDFPRATWQYDVVVLLILAFIFLTPRSIFRDQPHASSVVLLPEEAGSTVYWIEPDLLTEQSEPARINQAELILNSRTGKRGKIARLEPIFDAEKDIKGYMAFVKP